MFVLNLDITTLVVVSEGIDQAAKAAMRTAGNKLAVMTRAHIIEEANKKLHSRREMYIEGVTHHQLSDDTWVINLDAKVRWIDDGMEPHSMLDDLLKSPKAKTAKDGSKYIVVPFKHNKGPTQQTPAQKNLTDTIKAEMKKLKIPYGGIQKDEDGKTKYGLVGSFDIKDKPLKQFSGPGQGKGPIGSVKQGPTGIPLLQGVRIYQRPIPSSDGKGLVRKDIMTFRVASSKMRGQGRWDHPGLPAVKLMDEAYEWAKKTWEREIVPGLMIDISAKL